MDMVDGRSSVLPARPEPGRGSAHGRLQRLGMANLDWLVVRDLFEIESATFWKDGPEIDTGEISPETCRTEVFLFPAASHVEKEARSPRPSGCCSGGEKAVEPPGTPPRAVVLLPPRPLNPGAAGRLDREPGPAAARPDWDYPHVDRRRAEGRDVLREINGHDLTRARRVNGYPELKADGSTYLRMLDLLRRLRRRRQPGRAPQPPREQKKANAALSGAGRGRTTGDVLYARTRASADPCGGPAWSERKKPTSGGTPTKGENGEWTGGEDVPDFKKTKPPSYVPRPRSGGPAATARRRSVRHAGHRQKQPVLRPDGLLRTAPCEHTASRTNRRSTTPCTASRANPTRQGLRPRPDNPSTRPTPGPHRRGLPVRAGRQSRLAEHHTPAG